MFHVGISPLKTRTAAMLLACLDIGNATQNLIYSMSGNESVLASSRLQASLLLVQISSKTWRYQIAHYSAAKGMGETTCLVLPQYFVDGRGSLQAKKT